MTNQSKRCLEQLTWKEINSLIAEGHTTILVGFGSTEQHGPHLPISTDAAIAQQLCERVAQQTNGVLVAPTITIGQSEHHMELAGTITISPNILESYLIDYCLSLIKHGFKRIYIVPTHGGNFPIVEAVEGFFSRQTDVATQHSVLSCYALNEFVGLLHDTARSHNIPIETAGAHAGELETSIISYLFPDQVRYDKIRKGFVGDYHTKKKEADGQFTLSHINKDGIIGDATMYDSRRGEAYFSTIVDFIIQKISTLSQRGYGT